MIWYIVGGWVLCSVLTAYGFSVFMRIHHNDKETDVCPDC